MAGGIDWFRWHHGSVTDPKFQLVARKAGARLSDVLAIWAYVLEHASAADVRGEFGDLDHEAIDCLFGFDDGLTEAVLDQMTVRGLVCDGAIRDVGMLAGWDDFSVYSRFITPRGPMSAERGAVNRAVVIGGQMVQPGDLIIGDDDGLVALSPAHMRTYIGGAKDKMAREEEWLASLASGRSPTETFALPPAKRL